MDPITGTHCREAGAFAPPFFLRLIFSETRRGPPPASRAKPTGQHAPRRAARRRRTLDHGPNAKTQHVGTGPMRCRTTSSVARTADRGHRTGKKRGGARGHRVIFFGEKISRRGPIFAARGAVARVLVPCFSQIIM